MRKILTFSFALLCIHSFGQGYLNANETYGINVLNTGAISYGAGVSFYDFNKDGFDDLTFCTSSDSIVFYISNGDSFEREEILPNTVDAKQPTWVDYDNDGDADLMVTKRSNGTRLYRNDGWPNFTDVTADLNIPSIVGVNTFGNCWGDYDKDGDLDVYICNRNVNETTNYICKNNGDGTFIQVASEVGVANNGKYAFQGAWCDFNNDGWLDLYVVNDLYTSNSMYFNNGDGTFSEVAAETGTDLTIEAMCVNVGDYDNDHDFDIYVANVATGNFLLQNDGTGHFTNVAEAANLEVNMMTWGTQWVDFDNDMDLDIHMVTTNGGNNQNPFYVNNGDGTFTLANELGFAGDATNAYSNAIGDFNNDGFYDIAHTTVGSQNSYTLWENLGVGGNSVKIHFEGTISNKDAIGARIDYYVNGEHRTSFTQCGGSFIAQNTDNYVLGIGDALQIDSLHILWPTGMPETYYNLASGVTHLLIEGSTYNFTLTAENNNTICETLTLDAGDRPNYLWDDNSTEATRVITAPGVYTVTTALENGFELTSEIEITQGYIPSVTVSTMNTTCFGAEDGMIFLFEQQAESNTYLLNNQPAATTNNDLGAGLYTYEVISTDGCSATGVIEITEPTAIEASVITSNVLCNGDASGTAVLNATGGTGNITSSVIDADANQLEAGDYYALFFDEIGCWTQIEFTIEEPTVLEGSISSQDANNGANGSAEVTITGGTEPYTYAWSNGDEDATAENIGQGAYSCMITDANG
ncbi:MAG: FG-GAP-like repeat-containing protein, partial [Flavobacteriales bacterium]